MDGTFYHSLNILQDGSTALGRASRNGHDEVVRVLLKANATVDTQIKVRMNFNLVTA